MKAYIESRVLDVSKYMLATHATIRKTAQVFGVSKSTIAKDLKRLEKVNPQLVPDIRKVLDFNASMRYFRAGMAIKQKVRFNFI